MKLTVWTLSVLSLCTVVTAQQPTPARPVYRGRTQAARVTKQKKPVAPIKDEFFAADPAAEIETVRERFENGTVHIEREVTMDVEGNYIRHGNWTEWDQNGKEIAKGEYRDNQRHGDWVRIYSGRESQLFQEAPFTMFKAPFVSRAQFHEGELHGTWVVNDSEGRVVVNWQYNNGDGTWSWSYPNGKQMRQITYVNGSIDGELMVWDPKGELTTHHTYQKGRRLDTKSENYRSGKRKSMGVYLFAQKIVEKPDDWWKAMPAKYATIGQDDRHGRWNTWHENGQMECEGTYEYGLRTGVIQWWYPNGQLRLKGEYQAGKPIGDWVWWHPNGQKATLGHYQGGEPNGNWVYWNEDGRLVQRSDLSLASSPAPQPKEKKAPQSTRRGIPLR